MWLRLGEKGKFYNLPEYLIDYRVHSQGACVADRWGGAKDTLKIIKRYKNNYPHYFLALTKGYIRLFYSLILIVRDKFKL